MPTITLLLLAAAPFGQTDSVSPTATAEQPGPAAVTPDVAAATAFLRQTQNDDGSWGDFEYVGMTALAVTAMLRNDVPVDDPAVVEGLAFLRANTRDDGGMYSLATTHRNYDTALALVALELAGLPEDEQRKTAAVSFLKELQWDESDGIAAGNESFGGAGYGKHRRPDLSNTQVFIDALKQAGLSADDPAMQKALVFVSRTQNLESEHNKTEFAGLIEDGGFYYTPAAGGSSQAGQTPNGGLRSYASMTYAGLKSMIFAGLAADDPRVEAATVWIKDHYTLEENPGLDQQGLYYYYVTFAKTLHALGDDTFTETDGTEHDWAGELTAKLAATQEPDGSWINRQDRWMEGDKRLVTSYALIALAYARADRP